MTITISDLDDYQAHMHAEGRCIWCGSRKVRIVRGKDGRQYASLSCQACADTQRSHDDGVDFGPARASIAHELQRRLGGRLPVLAEMDPESTGRKGRR